MEAYRRTGATKSSEKMDHFFEMFDNKKKGYLDVSDFNHMLSQLFSHDSKPHPLDSQFQRQLFAASDKDGDGKVSKKEFEWSWKSWISEVLDPVTALLVIDVQNDFITGCLAFKDLPAKQDGAEVIDVINRLLDDVKFDVVVYTFDSHTPEHISFYENLHQWKIHPTSKIQADTAQVFDEVIFDTQPHPRSQILWPTHCIHKSHGYQLDSRLKVVEGHLVVDKGMQPDVDSYGAFWDNGNLRTTGLQDQLEAKHVTEIYVCGLAYDYCVSNTARQAAEIGYRTLFIEDACRGVGLDTMRATKKTLLEKDVSFIQTDEVPDLVQAKNRPAVGRRLLERIATKYCSKCDH